MIDKLMKRHLILFLSLLGLGIFLAQSTDQW